MADRPSNILLMSAMKDLLSRYTANEVSARDGIAQRVGQDSARQARGNECEHHNRPEPVRIILVVKDCIRQIRNHGRLKTQSKIDRVNESSRVLLPDLSNSLCA